MKEYSASLRNRTQAVFEPNRASRGWSRKVRRNLAGLFGIVVLAAIVVVLLLAPLLRLPDPLAQDLTASLEPPRTPGHLLGTDQFGRDLLSRLIWGGRISIAVGIIASLVAIGVGLPVALISGYMGGRLDSFIMRTTDIMLAFPYILLALVIVGISGPGLLNALLAVAIANIPFFVRMIRSIVLTISHQPFVEATVAVGATTVYVLRKAILPSLTPYLVVAFTTDVGWLVLETSGLSFLGLGAQPPLPEWGAMLAEARPYLVIAPHVAVIPGLAIFLLVVSLNLTGDLLQDVLDVEL
ncbi:MAG TPA: ABC transporter permease [bacterium]|nr:ABC transporter permease [bacterium]